MFRRKSKTPLPLPELEALARDTETCTHPHYHKDENGFLVQCYHVCKQELLKLSVKELFFRLIALLLVTTITYPFEHALYERVWPFYLLNNLMHGH